MSSLQQLYHLRPRLLNLPATAAAPATASTPINSVADTADATGTSAQNLQNAHRNLETFWLPLFHWLWRSHSQFLFYFE